MQQSLWFSEGAWKAGARRTNERCVIWLRCRNRVRLQQMMTARHVNDLTQNQWRTMGQADRGGLRHAVHICLAQAHKVRSAASERGGACLQIESLAIRNAKETGRRGGQ